MSASRRSRAWRRCGYCGGRIAPGMSCAQCAALAAADPHVLAGGGPLSEDELGIDPGWPERELEDEDAPE